MKDFDRWMTRQQVSWRATHITCTEWGEQNRKRYPWILPAELWEEGLWQGIRSNSPHPLPDYLRINHVQKHSGAHNLKSSWMLCANLYFPFGASSEGRALFAGFLQSHVSPEIQSVNAIELEYAEGGDLHPSVLLGETGGGRGAGQTSPDLGLLVNEGRGLVLLENKLLEHSFYQCSARRTASSSIRAGNPDPSRCENALTVAGGGLKMNYKAAPLASITEARDIWEAVRKQVIQQGLAIGIGAQIPEQKGEHIGAL